MKQTVCDILWFFVPVVTVLLGTLLLAVFGLATIDDGNISLSVGGSTHIGMVPPLYFLVMSSLLGFFIFLVRSAVYRFKNRGSNISLILYSLLFFIVLVYVMYALTQID